MKKSLMLLVCIPIFSIAQIPQDNLLAYYPFNGNAQDGSGNMNDGLVNGATLTTDRNGVSNAAYSFDGVNDWIDLGDNPSMHYTNSNTSSISLWMKSNSTSHKYQNIVRYDDLDNGDGDQSIPRSILMVRLNNTDFDNDYDFEFTFGYIPSSGPNDLNTSLVSSNTTPILVNSWYHIVLIKDDALQTVTIYVNDVEVFSASYVSSGVWETIGQFLMLGRYFDPQASQGPEYFSGDIDDVRFYGDVLSECEIHALYREGEMNFDPSVSAANGLFSSSAVGVNYQWVNCETMTVVPGETSQSFSPSNNDPYQVIISSGACIDTSDCLSLQDAGLEENDVEFANLLSIYPNPSSGLFMMDLVTKLEGQSIDLHIYDSSGKIIMNKQLKSNSFPLHVDLTAEQSGVYTIVARMENQDYVQKIIVR